MGDISTLGYTYNDDTFSAAGYIVDIILGGAGKEQIEDILQTRELKKVLHSWDSLADFWSYLYYCRCHIFHWRTLVGKISQNKQISLSCLARSLNMYCIL